jgi:hypothetical protein
MFYKELRWHYPSFYAGGRGREHFLIEAWPSINLWLTSLRDSRESRESGGAVILSGAPILLPETLCDPSVLYDKRSYKRLREIMLRRQHRDYRIHDSVTVKFIPTSAAEDWANTELAKLQKQCEASAAAGKPDAWTIIGHRAAVWIAAGHRSPEWLSDYLPPIK